jgi:hypothetical protein
MNPGGYTHKTPQPARLTGVAPKPEVWQSVRKRRAAAHTSNHSLRV